MYLTASYYHALEDRASKPARDRYAKFYRDLHKLYGKQITASTLCEGPGYSYTELGARV
jgi:hypothetical protein